MSETEDLLQSLGKNDGDKKSGLLVDLHKSDNPDESEVEADESGIEINEQVNKNNKTVASNTEGNSDNMAEDTNVIKDQVSEPDSQEGYDPDEQFRQVLADAGLKRGVKAISESFFNGDIDDPTWLHYILMEAGIGKKHRNLILMSYYGQPPAELGIKDDISKSPHYKQSLNGKRDDDENDESINFDKELRKAEIANLESVKRELAMKKMKKESLHLDNELENIVNKDKQVEVPKTRVVHRPLFDDEGNVRKDDGGRVIAERVVEPIPDGGSVNDPFTMMTTMMQMLNNQSSKETTYDPEIAEMKHMISDLVIQQKEASHKSELDRLRTEREAADRMYADNLKRSDDEARDRMDREHAEHMRQLDDMKRMFDDKLEQRDQMGQLMGAYEQKLDAMKELMREHQSTVKDTVVNQVTKTADKMTSQVGNVLENAVEPLSEMMKQQYQTNLELFRHQHGLSGSVIPTTSEDELTEYMRDE